MNTTAAIIITYILSVPAFVYLYLKKKNKADTAAVCRLILISGIILRVLYICYTSVYIRQHDVEDFSLVDDGHAAYILYLMNNKCLPEINPDSVWQFYHPPLHHIICALFLSALNRLSVPPDPVGYELLQVLPCLYSFLFCILSYKTLELFGINGKALCYSTAFVTFHPTLILLSGSINNDMLAALLSMSAIYFTVKWSKDKKLSDIIFTAFCIGFGMASKLTAGLVAPAVALVFLYVFIKNIKEYKRLILQFVLFGIICIPIGLFFPIRNYVKFGLPFNYVPMLSDSDPQHIDKPFFERLLNFSLYQFSSPFIQWGSDTALYNEFNPTIALWKTAAFDGDTFFHNNIAFQAVCVILFFCTAFLSVYSAYLLVKNAIKRSCVNTEHQLLITALSLTIYINYLIFCKDYPHVCTQNMRYCVPLIFTQAALFGRRTPAGRFRPTTFSTKSIPEQTDLLKNNSSERFCLIIKEAAISLFCCSSILVYTFLQFT